MKERGGNKKVRFCIKGREILLLRIMNETENDREKRNYFNSLNNRDTNSLSLFLKTDPKKKEDKI